MEPYRYIALILFCAWNCFAQPASVNDPAMFKHAATPTGPTNVTSGLAGWWTFDENSGTTAHDLSGNHNNGTLTGSALPTWTTGEITNALSFNGSSAYVDVPNSSSINISGSNQPITVCCWVNWAGPTEANNTVVEKQIQSYGAGFGLVLKSNYQVAFYVDRSDNTGNYVDIDGTGGTIPLSQWVWLAFTYDGATMTSYTNGAFNTSVAGSMNWGGNTADLWIGHSVFGSGRWFKGSIDDLRIYNRALSFGEITNLYHLWSGK